MLTRRRLSRRGRGLLMGESPTAIWQEGETNLMQALKGGWKRRSQHTWKDLSGTDPRS
jgi:hypothetical protein